MKRLFSFVGAMGTVLLASAQLTNISVETVLEHDGSIAGIPAGYTTYRIYANLTNEYDFVSAVYGDAQDPMFLNSTGTILHQEAGGDYATNVNSDFYSFFPALPYDSWLTIGASSVQDGVDVQTTFSTSSEAIVGFNNDNGFVVEDPTGGSWFNVYNCGSASPTDLQLDSLVIETYNPLDSCNAPVDTLESGDIVCILDSVFMEVTELEFCANDGLSFAGDDSRVLLAQVTTDGVLTGMLNVQVFVNGSQAEPQLATAMTFSTNPADVFGCTDPLADNYDASLGANVDDLSCIFPCTLALESAAFTISPPTCSGDNDAFILAAAVGAQGADYFYLDSISENFSNNGNFTGSSGYNLQAGTYDVIVVDAAQCGDTLSVTIPAVDPVTMTAELTTAVSCHNAADGVITITDVSGGDGNYTFGISSNPAELSNNMVWEGIGNTSGDNQTYSFTVFDGNGCTGSSEGILVLNPAEVNVGLNSVNPIIDASCANVADGAIYLIASGGGTNSVGPFEFSVDGENFAPSPLSVTGGTFTVTARDPLGCTATLENEVVVGPPAIEVNAAVEPELCAGDANGEVSWAPLNGDGNYTFTFDGEATTETMAGDLAPGTYTVVVTDGEGCSGEETVEVEAALAISVSTDVVDASCFEDNDGSITVNAVGGSGAFQYSEDGNNYIPNNEFGGFTAGTYTLFVQDEFGCVESGSATVGQPDAIVITGIVSEGSDPGEGTIDVTVTGGNLPYEYEWIGQGVSGQSTQDLEGISSGSYTVEVTDANGCSSIETFNITTDLREIEAGVLATVYPNPSQGVFTVDIMGGIQGQVQYHVVDAQGRQILNGQWNASEGFFRTDLDLSAAEAGMYRLVMMANGRPSSLQLIKTH